MTAAGEQIRAIALARPRDLGEPGTRWSLATLRRYLVRKRVVSGLDLQGAPSPGPPKRPGLGVTTGDVVPGGMEWVVPR